MKVYQSRHKIKGIYFVNETEKRLTNLNITDKKHEPKTCSLAEIEGERRYRRKHKCWLENWNTSKPNP
jgi:hypothetical protein